jgi:hypothetical protein
MLDESLRSLAKSLPALLAVAGGFGGLGKLLTEKSGLVTPKRAGCFPTVKNQPEDDADPECTIKEECKEE